ncbi:hypothetical protein [Anaeromyxobacter sp. SG66]|uniref:hypothetical protein n=1 Tax=Anaeromyxobacter sp. SG66 TaxID=2925410 RepID=UPI001F582307|nr:hypothetical protein [Anaeromyxobacter sp. SG66]
MIARRLAVVLAAALAASPAARAQTSPSRRAPATAAKKPAAKALAAPAAPAIAAEPAPAPAPVAQGPAPVAAETAGGLSQEPPAGWFAEPEWRIATLLGAEFGIGDASYSALKLRVDAERTVRALSPRAALGWVISAGVLHASDSQDVPVPMMGTVAMEWGANLFEVVPAARVTYALGPKLWIHGDAGLGVAYTAASGSVDVPGIGHVEPVSGGVAGVARLAGGLAFTPTPNVRVGAQLVGFDVRFGDGVGSAFSFLVSASHRL